mgnify:FL=1
MAYFLTAFIHGERDPVRERNRVRHSLGAGSSARRFCLALVGSRRLLACRETDATQEYPGSSASFRSDRIGSLSLIRIFRNFLFFCFHFHFQINTYTIYIFEKR